MLFGGIFKGKVIDSFSVRFSFRLLCVIYCDAAYMRYVYQVSQYLNYSQAP
jgi:hypothetical protein